MRSVSGSAAGKRQIVMRPEGVGGLVGSLLGLLAFVLALTLSFASERFNERRLGTLAETNALGTRGCGPRRSGNRAPLGTIHNPEKGFCAGVSCCFRPQ